MEQVYHTIAQVTYPLPQTVTLAGGRLAHLDHATDYTEAPAPGEEVPPHRCLFSYYRMEGETDLRRVQLRLKTVKFAPDQVAPIVATLLGRPG